jgi:hypothetical protein
MCSNGDCVTFQLAIGDDHPGLKRAIRGGHTRTRPAPDIPTPARKEIVRLGGAVVSPIWRRQSPKEGLVTSSEPDANDWSGTKVSRAISHKMMVFSHSAAILAEGFSNRFLLRNPLSSSDPQGLCKRRSRNSTRVSTDAPAFCGKRTLQAERAEARRALNFRAAGQPRPNLSTPAARVDISSSKKNSTMESAKKRTQNSSKSTTASRKAPARFTSASKS